MRKALITRKPSPLFSDPFFRGFERLFNDDLLSRWNEGPATGRWIPPVDVREHDDALEFTVELPGLAKDDIDITVEDRVLTLAGERKFESGEEKNAARERACSRSAPCSVSSWKEAPASSKTRRRRSASSRASTVASCVQTVATSPSRGVVPSLIEPWCSTRPPVRLWAEPTPLASSQTRSRLYAWPNPGTAPRLQSGNTSGSSDSLASTGWWATSGFNQCMLSRLQAGVRATV